MEWSGNIPDCLAPITQLSTQLPVTSERTETAEQSAAPITQLSTQLPVTSERTETAEQSAGACAGVGAAVAFGILFLAALVGIGYWKMSTNSKNPKAPNRDADKTLRLAKLSPNDGQTATESRRDEEYDQAKDSGWADNKVYESSDDPTCPEYIEINPQSLNPDIYAELSPT